MQTIKMFRSSTITLKNGIIIKGSYSPSVHGTYIDLFICSRDGVILGRKSFANREPLADMSVMVGKLVSIAEKVMVQYKIDQLTSPKVLEAVVPFVIEKLFPKDKTAKKAA
jgi:hypothetical protein